MTAPTRKNRFVLFLFIVIVLAAFACFVYYIFNSKSEVYPASNISADLFNNPEIMKAYNDCFITQKNITELELQQCKRIASKAWLTQDVEDANCYVAQAKTIEAACESIITSFRKK